MVTASAGNGNGGGTLTINLLKPRFSVIMNLDGHNDGQASPFVTHIEPRGQAYKKKNRGKR